LPPPAHDETQLQLTFGLFGLHHGGEEAEHEGEDGAHHFLPNTKRAGGGEESSFESLLSSCEGRCDRNLYLKEGKKNSPTFLFFNATRSAHARARLCLVYRFIVQQATIKKSTTFNQLLQLEYMRVKNKKKFSFPPPPL